MKLEESSVLITGAAGGIGSAVAKRFSSAGAKLLLTDLRSDTLDTVVARLLAEGADVVGAAADIATESGRALLTAMSREREVDVLVNVAGINPFGLFAEQTAAEIEKALLINTTAPMLLCHALIPILDRSVEARIVNVGSVFGSIGFPGFCAYSASKFAIRGFSEALRRELADTSIDVHYVAPRATRTALTTERVRAMNEELNVAMDPPEVVARAVERALRERRREIHVGFPEKLIARINAIVPGVVDRVLRKQLPIVRRYAAQSPTPADTTRQLPINQRA
jgi:short-subunit dehydrogenase